MSSRQGQLFEETSNSEIKLYFVSSDDIEDLCNVINWAYRGKPSITSPGDKYSGWISEQHLISGARITTSELKELIDDEEKNVILVAKLPTSSRLEIVGCCKINLYDPHLQIGDEEKSDRAVEFGLKAVDPDYQSRGIGTILVNGAERIAKEHFHASRVYSRIISSKENQIDWHLRHAFIHTGRFAIFPFGERFQTKVNCEELKFVVLTKRLE